MRHDDKRKLYEYFSKIKNKTKEEQNLFAMVGLSLDEYDITSVSKDDAEEIGFDCANADSSKMESIAYRMANAYMDDTFWDDLKIIAEAEGLKLKWDFLDDNGKLEIVDDWYCNADNHELNKVLQCIYSGLTKHNEDMAMSVWDEMSIEEQIRAYEEAVDKGIIEYH